MRSFTQFQKYLLISFALTVLAAHLFENPHCSPFSSPGSPSHAAFPLVAEITGAVKNPGVFLFSSPPTIDQTVQQAGGFHSSLKRPLSKGPSPLQTGTHLQVTPSKDEASYRYAFSEMDGRKRFVLGLPLDINQADTETLSLIPGITDTLAARIVAFRKVHGPLSTWDALLKIKGMGPSKLKGLKRHAGIPY